MPGWHILLLFIFIPLARILVDIHRLVNTPGKMRIRRSITEAACYVDPRDRSLLVKLDDLPTRDIFEKPEKVSAHGFSIHLLGCSLGDSQHPGNLSQRTSITFSGTPDSDNPSYLSVQSETENLAIKICDGKGKQIHLGEPSPGYALNPGKNTLSSTAYLISRDERITSDEFTVVMRFVASYLWTAQQFGYLKICGRK